MTAPQLDEQLAATLTRAATALTLAHQIHSALRSLAQTPPPHSLWRTNPAFRFTTHTT